MKYFIICVILFSILCANATAQQADNGTGFNEKYGMLIDRNIFMKNRPRPRGTPTSRPTEVRTVRNDPNDRSSATSPDRTLVLRGIVIEDNELRAYVENTKTNTISRVAPGDSIASGMVGEIAIDAMQYSADGQSIWVLVGHDLRGEAYAAPVSTSIIRPTIVAPAPVVTAGSGATGVPATQPGVDGAPAAPSVDISTLSIEEQMKLRRQQQLNNK